MAAEVIKLPFQQARVDRRERWRTHSRWGDLQAQTLTNVLRRAADGDVADLVDLCEFAIDTDAHIASLYDTRISRVAQADYVIVPSTFGDRRAARQAARLTNECMARVENWHQAKRDLLHGIAVGFSVGENDWEYDSETQTNYIRRIDHCHGHRFRYDEQWQLRLYDHGTRRSEASLYGEALIPLGFTVHQYRLQAGYPGIGGLMRPCLWQWMFRRWVSKFWIGYVEKNGDPLTYAIVPANTKESVRNAILAQLQNLSNDHVGVVEEPGQIVVEATAAATKSYEAYQQYMSWSDGELTKLWLGASDITDPGKHGSQSAVDTRASLTIDPRMITDGDGFAQSLQSTMFRQLIQANPHKFEISADRVPVPSMRLKTADDEVDRDATDYADEQQAESSGYTPEVGRAEPEQAPDAAPKEPAQPEQERAPLPEEASIQKQALNGAQVTSLLELVKAAAAAEVPRDSALEMILVSFPTVDRGQAERLLGTIGRGFETPQAQQQQQPTQAPQPEIELSGDASIQQGLQDHNTRFEPDKDREASASPKARAPVTPGQTARTRLTSSRSQSPFALGLRAASGASERSPSKPQPKR